jgi:hypothetical protein
VHRQRDKSSVGALASILSDLSFKTVNESAEIGVGVADPGRTSNPREGCERLH